MLERAVQGRGRVDQTEVTERLREVSEPAEVCRIDLFREEPQVVRRVEVPLEDVERLLDDPGMIRNRRKIEATINNARRLLEVREEFGSFDRYIWGFVGGKPIKNRFRSFKEMPSKTERSEVMTRDLKRRGFKFVGPTICYSFMQAVGMVNDHIVHCFRYNEV